MIDTERSVFSGGEPFIGLIFLGTSKFEKYKSNNSLIGISMKEHRTKSILASVILAVTSVFCVSVANAQTLDEVLGVRTVTTKAGRTSQSKIDEIKDDTRDLLSQYKQVMKIVDGLRVYNKQQERLIAQQEREMAELNTSIDNVTVIERQIGPLLQRMIDNLEKFVSLDVPFLMSERNERIEFLTDMMERADVTVSEKFSQVMQAYQVENSYGSTLEAYTDVITLNGKSRQVDMLKFGRVSLVFQTPDGEITGVWDNKKRDWEILGDEYRADVRDGLRMARKTATPNLVRMPISAPESAK
jgi:sugar-specific transcriptional regulator TrmB